jgi:hypothetical protein
MRSAEMEILLACARRSLSSSHRDRIRAACRLGPIDWHSILYAALEHKIAPLVYQNLMGPITEMRPISINRAAARLVAGRA